MVSKILYSRCTTCTLATCIQKKTFLPIALPALLHSAFYTNVFPFLAIFTKSSLYNAGCSSATSATVFVGKGTQWVLERKQSNQEKLVGILLKIPVSGVSLVVRKGFPPKEVKVVK